MKRYIFVFLSFFLLMVFSSVLVGANYISLDLQSSDELVLEAFYTFADINDVPDLFDEYMSVKSEKPYFLLFHYVRVGKNPQINSYAIFSDEPAFISVSGLFSDYCSLHFWFSSGNNANVTFYNLSGSAYSLINIFSSGTVIKAPVGSTGSYLDSNRCYLPATFAEDFYNDRELFSSFSNYDVVSNDVLFGDYNNMVFFCPAMIQLNPPPPITQVAKLEEVIQVSSAVSSTSSIVLGVVLVVFSIILSVGLIPRVKRFFSK